MGCINTEVSVVSRGINVIINKLSTFIATLIAISSPTPTITTATLPPLLFSTEAVSSPVSSTIEPAGKVTSSSISIVCTTSIGEEEFLEVVEGRLFAIEDGYLKVLVENV